MLEFHLHRPQDMDSCLNMLAEHGEHAALLAGGTDLHVLMRTGLRTPGHVIELGPIGELRFMREEEGKHIIGSAATHAEVASHFKSLDCLSRAAGSVGSPQIRNVGTVGGNIANASPSGDIYPPLLALDAAVTLASVRGARQVALADVPAGPGESCIGPEEMITSISFPKPAAEAFTGFMKVGLRGALAISVASAAVVALGDGGAITGVRIACGAVAPRPFRMHEVEDMVKGKAPSPGLLDEAAEAAGALCCPISDIRATAGYRRRVTGVIVRRLLEGAMRRVAGYGGGG